MDAALIDEALVIADAAGTPRAAAAALRTRFAALRVVVVDAFDMRGETPVAVGATLQLFLGASDGHCWSVTGDAAAARGFFLCERA